jgi:hypothetical protein
MPHSLREARAGEWKEEYVDDRGGFAGVEARGVVVESRRAFDAWLHEWFRTTRNETVGDVRGGSAQVSVRVAGEWCHLDAATTRAGVFQYLQHMRLAGGALDWHVVAGLGGRVDRIGVGREKRPISGFQLHTERGFVDTFALV